MSMFWTVFFAVVAALIVYGFVDAIVSASFNGGKLDPVLADKLEEITAELQGLSHEISKLVPDDLD